MVRYQDIINDVNSKLFLLDKWLEVYKLAQYYDSYLDACYGDDARRFMQNIGMYGQEFVSTSHIVYDLSCIPGLTEFLRFWNSYDLKGKYIYRATTIDYVRDYVISSTPFMIVDSEHSSENDYISFWSVSPYTSDYFIHKYIKLERVKPGSIRVLVAPYDDNMCSKDWYDNISPEYTVVINNKPYNFGLLSYLRELEVRCFKYPISKLVYALTYNDFMELMKYLPKKYVYSK